MFAPITKVNEGESNTPRLKNYLKPCDLQLSSCINDYYLMISIPDLLSQDLLPSQDFCHDYLRIYSADFFLRICYPDLLSRDRHLLAMTAKHFCQLLPYFVILVLFHRFYGMTKIAPSFCVVTPPLGMREKKLPHRSISGAEYNSPYPCWPWYHMKCN
jgi:hypothetical protein